MPKKPRLVAGLSASWSAELHSTVRGRPVDVVGQIVARALQAFERGDYNLAAKLADEAKQSASRSGQIRELLALSHYHSERWHDALREMLTYKRFTGRKDENHVIADCYRADGRLDKALEIISQVHRGEVNEETWIELMIVGASIHAELGDLRRALSDLTRAEGKTNKLEPHHLRLRYVKADLLEKAGRKSEAQDIWHSIFQADPRFFDVAEKLGS